MIFYNIAFGLSEIVSTAVPGNDRWKGMTWGMMPLLGGALSACTYHFFYNSPDLDFLVVLQVHILNPVFKNLCPERETLWQALSYGLFFVFTMSGHKRCKPMDESFVETSSGSMWTLFLHISWQRTLL